MQLKYEVIWALAKSVTNNSKPKDWYNKFKELSSSVKARWLLLEGIMPPILQRPIASTVGVVFCTFFLGEMSLAVRHNAAHVIDIVSCVLSGMSRGIMFQDTDNLTTTRLLKIIVSIWNFCLFLLRLLALYLPFMPNCLPRFTIPSCWLWFWLFEPASELSRSHIDQLLELTYHSWPNVSPIRFINKKYSVTTHSITIFWSFTISATPYLLGQVEIMGKYCSWSKSTRLFYSTIVPFTFASSTSWLASLRILFRVSPFTTVLILIPITLRNLNISTTNFPRVWCNILFPCLYHNWAYLLQWSSAEIQWKMDGLSSPSHPDRTLKW